MLWLRPCKLHDDFSGIKYYCVTSCENECMYSWQVKFNNEIIYYRHLTYYVDSVKPKMVIFLLGNSWKVSGTWYFDISFVTCKQSGPYTYTHMYSWFNKGCFGHWELSNSKLLFGGDSGKSYCIVWYAQMPNNQPLLNQLYTV